MKTKQRVLTIILCCLFPMVALSSSRPQEKKATLPEKDKTIYEIAEEITGAPAHILRGIALTESGENDTAIGDDGISKGRMQLNENYHAERAEKYGAYNPFDPLESVIIAGYLYMDNLKRFGDSDLAIAAHRQGVSGVREYGACDWYIKRVKEYSRTR